MSVNTVFTLERDIVKSPNILIFPRFTIGVVLGNELFAMIGMTPRVPKIICNFFLWVYYVGRLYFQYSLWDTDLFLVVVFHMICSD